jgi:flagellar hook-associated protein 2
MATITSLGIGSGIDVNGLVESLITAERELPQLRLDTREAELQAQLSSFGLLQGAMSSFKDTVSGMRTASSASALSAKSSDTSVLTASAVFTAEEGRHSIEVEALAQGHAMASAAFADINAEVGTGTLSFTFGTSSYDVDGVLDGFTKNDEKTTRNVEITDGSLEGIRDAVNSADIGVTASVVNVGSEGYKLLFSSDDVGARNSLEITVADNETDNVDMTGLSQLAYGVGNTNMSETLAAQDASILYNGLSVSRDSNTVSDLVKGVTLNLNAVSEEGIATDVTVTKSLSSIKSKINDFVSGYNQLVSVISSQTDYDPETGVGAILQGDGVVRNIEGLLRKELFESVKIGDNNNITLAGIGITTQSDGTLQVNDNKLDAAIDADLDLVANLFAMNGNESGAGVKYISGTANTNAGVYRLNVSQVATQGSYTSNTDITGFTVNASNDSFTINVDGIESDLITLSHAAPYADGAALAKEIQASINADSALKEAGAVVSVAFEANRFVITSEVYGSASTVEMVSAEGFGLSGGISTDGVDIQGTIGGEPATGKGQFLTSNGVASNGLNIEYSGTDTGTVGSTTVSRGYADRLFNLVDELLSTGGGLQGKTNGIEARIADLSEQRVTLEKRLLAKESLLRSQFGAMDILVAQLQATGNFLTDQLASLPKIGGRDR